MRTAPITPFPFARAKALIALLIVGCTTLSNCSYDEEVELCQVEVRLEYPENTVSAYAGARVEMKDATASVFVDSTDATGAAHFTLPPGIYEATTSDQYVDSTGTDWWRYIFNGVRSLIIISPDSTNVLTLPLKMSRKRIVH